MRGEEGGGEGGKGDCVSGQGGRTTGPRAKGAHRHLPLHALVTGDGVLGAAFTPTWQCPHLPGGIHTHLVAVTILGPQLCLPPGAQEFSPGEGGGGRHSVSHARSRGLLGASHVGHPPCYVTGSLIATLRVPLEVRPSAKWLQPPSRLPSPKGTAHTSAEAP